MVRERDRPRLWRAAFAVIGWAALALQYLLLAGPADGWAVVTRTVQYFSFFTILTNILVALALTGPLLKPTRPLARWTASPAFRAAVTTYILIVGVVYHFMIAPYWRPEGLTLGVNLVLHYVMPVAFLLDWLWFTPKGDLRWGDPVTWLAFPLGYGLWTTAQGVLVGRQPYWFADFGASSWTSASITYGLLLGLNLIMGWGIVAIDRAAKMSRQLG